MGQGGSARRLLVLAVLLSSQRQYLLPQAPQKAGIQLAAAQPPTETCVDSDSFFKLIFTDPTNPIVITCETIAGIPALVDVCCDEEETVAACPVACLFPGCISPPPPSPPLPPPTPVDPSPPPPLVAPPPGSGGGGEEIVSILFDDEISPNGEWDFDGPNWFVVPPEETVYPPKVGETYIQACDLPGEGANFTKNDGPVPPSSFLTFYISPAANLVWFGDEIFTVQVRDDMGDVLFEVFAGEFLDPDQSDEPIFDPETIFEAYSFFNITIPDDLPSSATTISIARNSDEAIGPGEDQCLFYLVDQVLLTFTNTTVMEDAPPPPAGPGLAPPLEPAPTPGPIPETGSPPDAIGPLPAPMPAVPASTPEPSPGPEGPVPASPPPPEIGPVGPAPVPAPQEGGPAPEEIGPAPAQAPDEIGPTPAPTPEDNGPTPAPVPQEAGPTPAPGEFGPTPVPSPDETGPTPAPAPQEISPMPGPTPEGGAPVPAPALPLLPPLPPLPPSTNQPFASVFFKGAASVVNLSEFLFFHYTPFLLDLAAAAGLSHTDVTISKFHNEGPPLDMDIQAVYPAAATPEEEEEFAAALSNLLNLLNTNVEAVFPTFYANGPEYFVAISELEVESDSAPPVNLDGSTGDALVVLGTGSHPAFISGELSSGWTTYVTEGSLVVPTLEMESAVNVVLLFTLDGSGAAEGGFLTPSPFAISGFALSWVKLIDGNPNLEFIVNDTVLGEVIDFAIGADMEDLIAGKWVYIMIPVESPEAGISSLGFRTPTGSTFEVDAFSLVVY
mmetsp:Transcript_3200/g.11588  ORF Transcript_3200/g.11588 Transcript_3200/m.11588 type:complete len:783 (-) Transcript_3200:2115-4463(-)